MVAAHRLAETIDSENLRRFGGRDIALWSMSIVVVCAVQAGGLYLLSVQPSQAELPGAPPPAIMIELADMAMAPQVEDIAVDDGELSLPPENSASAEPSPAEEVPEEPVPDVEEPPPPEPEEIVEPAPEPEPIPEEVEEPLEEPPPEDIPEPVEEVLEEPIPDLAPAETAEVFVPMPVTRPAEIDVLRRQYAQQKQREQEQRERDQRAQQQQAASQQTAPRSVQAQQSQQTAAPQQTTTTQRTPNVSPQQWQSQVMAMIERAKRYPQDAQRRREQGTVQMQFVIDRSGAVLSASILRSSGYASLDQAGRDLINRLTRLPPPPASITTNPISLQVAVNFTLR